MEQQEKKELTTEELKQRELDLAAYHFLTGSKRARSLAGNMKAGGLARVLTMLLEFPLVQGDPKKFRSTAESELFFLGLRMLEAKSKMISEHKDKILEGQEEALSTVSQELKQPTEGESNESETNKEE